MQKLFAMLLLVCADKEQTVELQSSITIPVAGVVWVNDLKSTDTEPFDVIFVLNNIPDTKFWDATKSKTIFINEPIFTKDELKLPARAMRINGWPGFLQRRIWEVAGEVNEDASNAATVLDKELVYVKDISGLISARVISAIISEAITALEEGISTREDIDLALKLGTNYPFGPFEWNERIGPEKIRQLSSRIYDTGK